MIGSVIVTLIAGCMSPILENISTERWNSIDTSNFKVAIKRCKAIYPEAPCLKKFIKVEPRTYRVICGEKN